ncbi:gp061 [Rhodococcus phage ReqiPoco6]|uniref:Gp061 n=1 Tax=Rhodococcus phage ReqiPoco6 TaxID=691964 RepID=D4P7S9_9CAUD|nr:gp061 [Rhodococcus phage ReqiPoco6]ADD81059.1 gp061 [Rhodococcus phage ReqiPoco6]
MKRIISWWRESRKWRHCPHRRLRGVYGDWVYQMPNQRRLICLDCGNSLDGPVSLAEEQNDD